MPRKLKALKEKVEILEKKLEYQNTTKVSFFMLIKYNQITVQSAFSLQKKELSRELDKFKAEVKQLLAGKMMSESIKFNVIKETSGNQIENQNIINVSSFYLYELNQSIFTFIQSKYRFQVQTKQLVISIASRMMCNS